MKSNTRKLAATAVTLGALGLFASAFIYAQAALPFDKRTYVWYGEFVSLDDKARAVTVKVPIEAPVAKYVTEFKAGDKVVIIWVANAGKPDTGPALYIAKYDVTKASKIDVGYILPVEFVSADPTTKTATVKATIPEGALSALKTITAGQWIKVTTPMSQPADMAAIASVQGAMKPAAFVRDKPAAPAPPPPPSVAKVATPEDYANAMKAIGATFGAVNKAIQAGATDDAKAQLAAARSTMMAVEAFWVGKKKDDPAMIAKDAVAKMDALDKALSGSDAAATAAAVKEVGGTCGACHGKYREQDPVTKAFSIKAGTL